MVQRPQLRVPEPAEEAVERIAPPALALANGWMSLESTGANRFLRAHPTYDGRGVLIGVLDTGIDPSIRGLTLTPTGDPKVLDVVDFSGEGAVSLTRARPLGDSIEVGGRWLGGFGRVMALNSEGPYYVGAIAEIPLGEPPASDLNGNGIVADTLGVVVTRATDGWVVLAYTDGVGSLAGERPVRDYLVGREWFGWSSGGRAPPIGVAADLVEEEGQPRLTLVFDLSGHGSHVAGIAAAHELYGVQGLNGVAPGAQLLGLKISNSAQGSVSTTGAMVRAIDYAIRFAERRRLALVLNLSFGVGNEIEGSARIDQIIESVLERHPSVVMTVSAGNDGPGLSTIMFPGSAGRAITVGATLPPSFLPAAPGSGAPEERVAYFSARGGELAKPDVVAPGVAYSSVPRWNAGDEVKQGTSMAAPHAAGLAALLLSALGQERRPASAARVRRALMVTARAAPDVAFVNEGRGLPDVEAAYQWLGEDRAASEVRVRAKGSGRTAAWIRREAGAAADSVVHFELLGPASAGAETYALRGDVSWLRPPPRVTLGSSPVELAVPYSVDDLARPGAYSGTVTGWAGDTLAGPAFRLVVTIVTPAPSSPDSIVLRSGAAVAAGDVLRSFFLADTARPFEVVVATGPAQRGIAFLHEPNGAPYRAGQAAPAGDDPARYPVDARDVRPGAYEVDITPAPGRDLTATITVHHAPFSMSAVRSADGVAASLTGVGSTARADLTLGLIGGERTEAVIARGSAERRVPFQLPSWATGVVVDVSMERSQWGRFTDFGVTLFDSTGRQLGKDPLDYAFGRLSVDVPAGQNDREVSLGLFPGFADPADSSDWSVRISIRLYADSTALLAAAGGDSAGVTIARGATVTRRFRLPESPWRLGPDFFPLGVMLARSGGRVWTREVGLPPVPRSTSR